MPTLLRNCVGTDVNYCNASNPIGYNFYWVEMEDHSGSPFFTGEANGGFSLAEYDDGTALIQGTTVQGSCVLEVYIVLKDKKNWNEWSNGGGGFKSQGCSNPTKELLTYYVVDKERSYVNAVGGDCLEQGTFVVSQRPDPEDINTPNYGVHKGVGGALFDTDTQTEGIAGWGWMGPQGDEQRWKIDFNFLLNCEDQCREDTEEQVTLCAGESYHWAVTDTSYTAMQSPVMVTLEDNNGCEYTAKLIINEHPETDDIEDTVTVCAGESYHWAVTDMSYTAMQSPVMVTLEDNNGCEYTAKLTINEHPETDDIEDVVTVCSGESYHWVVTDMSYTAAQSPVMVTLEDNNGCEYTAKLTINEHPETDDIEDVVTVCAGESYHWVVTDMSYTAAQSPVMVTLEDNNGCEYTAKLTINEHPETDDIEDTVMVCAGESYHWAVTDMSYTAMESPVMVTLEDNNGCEYTAKLIINEHPVTDDIEEEVVICEGTEYLWDVTGESYGVSESPVMVTLQDQNGCDYNAQLVISEEDCGGTSCETAFARHNDGSMCFLDELKPNSGMPLFNRWGWTNLFSTAGGSYTMDFYAGAGQCVITNDRKWGEVEVEFENGMVTVTVNMLPGFVLNITQMYVGMDKYPEGQNGNPTVAPGQYPYTSGTLNEVMTYEFPPVDVSNYNEVYIIVHGDVCEKTNTPPIVQRPQDGISAKVFQKPYTKMISMELDMMYDSGVSVEFLDLSGRMVKRENIRSYSAGKHMVNYEVSNLATEVHILKIVTEREVITKKIIIRN